MLTFGHSDDSVSVYERNATTGETQFEINIERRRERGERLEWSKRHRAFRDGEFTVAGGEDDSISWFERDRL